jgi:L-ascorbate metabolism protein UlaG (beta-lactamase superfamily)
MSTSIRFLGLAAFEITTPDGLVVLIDPCLDTNPASPVHVAELTRVDLVLVTHLAVDHLGDAAAISRKFNCPVVCGAEVKAFLSEQGMDAQLIRTVPWGGQVNPLGLRIRAVECHHTSFRKSPQGNYLAGQPLGFILYVEKDVRIYHSGDTTIFSDLKLIGSLYKPTVGLMCACEIEKDYLENMGLKDHFGNEMSGDEGALAAGWLGVKHAILCHYLHNENHEDIDLFIAGIRKINQQEGKSIIAYTPQPGETIQINSEEV